MVEIVGLQLSLPLGSMYNPADALIQRCLMDQDPFLDVINFTLRICAAQGLSASAGRLRLTLALAGSAWTVHSDDGALEQRVDPTYAAAAETAVEAGTTLGNSAGAQLAATWRAAYGRHPDPRTALAQAIKAVESAATPVLTPNGRQATLGRLIGALDRDTARWRLPLATTTARATRSSLMPPSKLRKTGGGTALSERPRCPATAAGGGPSRSSAGRGPWSGRRPSSW